MAAEKGSDLVAIAAGGHGTPAAVARAGIVIKEETAGGIGAAANGSSGTFNEKLSGGAGNGGEEPFEASFTGHEGKGPSAVAKDEFVVAFRDAQDFVDRLSPGVREGFPIHDASEDSPQRLAQTKGMEQDRIDSFRIGGKKRAKTRGALVGNQTGVDEEGNKLAPRQIGGRRGVREIEGQAAGDEGRFGARRGGHERIRQITTRRPLSGYITFRSFRVCLR